eukprot:scaffold1636_cov165-Ochromonas_danica.AAC.10
MVWNSQASSKLPYKSTVSNFMGEPTSINYGAKKLVPVSTIFSFALLSASVNRVSQNCVVYQCRVVAPDLMGGQTLT